MSHSVTILYLTGCAEHAADIQSQLAAHDALEVITVTTAEEALEEVGERPDFSCLLVAYDLPDTDGISFITQFREAFPEIPVVLYPEAGSKELAVEAVSADVTEYLEYSSKEHHISQLIETIQDAVEDTWRHRVLEERIKELQGIQHIRKIIGNQSDKPLQRVLEDVVDRIPDSFQYPPVTEAKLTVGDTVARTDHFHDTEQCLQIETVCADETPITLTVCYTQPKPAADEGPFLHEERSLCQTILTILCSMIERRTYFEELRESELLFRQLAENIHEVAWISTWPEGVILYVNNAYEELWGQPVDSLYQDHRSYLETVHPEDRDWVTDAIQRQETGAYDEEYRIIQPGGEVRWVHDRAVPVTDGNGDVYRIVGLTADITERKQHEQQLAVLNRIVRHNLRNELNVVLSNAELLSADAPTTSVADRADRIIEASERLMTVADKQRSIANHLTDSIHTEFVPINDLIQNLVATLQSSYPESTITTEINTEPSILIPSQIEAGIEELVVNALEHTGENAEVLVETQLESAVASTTPTNQDHGESSEEPGVVTITITDNGPGISMSEIEKLGEKEEELIHGSGVGLWLVYWLVSRAGGTVSFDHTPTHGTQVALRLPEVRRAVE